VYIYGQLIFNKGGSLKHGSLLTKSAILVEQNEL
jgi:hypothetical protein